jgi:hypothetical protein
VSKRPGSAYRSDRASRLAGGRKWLLAAVPGRDRSRQQGDGRAGEVRQALSEEG